MSDLVSVIIPLYNRGDRIIKTLQSVQVQTHKNLECIIVDDGSTDDGVEKVSAFAKADARFSIHKRPADRLKGANACRNYGFELSKGEYINFLDSDDLFLPEKLEKQVRALQQSTHPFSICQTRIWNETRQKDMGLRCASIISERPLDDYIQFNIFWGIQAPLFKRSVIEGYPFNEELQQSQEYDLYIRLLAKYSEYHTTDEVLTTIIAHDSNLSTSTVDSVLKFKSNIKVRFSTLSMLHAQLLPETRLYLFNYIASYYKQMLQQRAFNKAAICLRYMVPCTQYLESYKDASWKYTLRWSLALASFFVTNKGMSLLKFNY